MNGDRLTAALAAVRRPEHTGERRCWPCTAVNLFLLGAGTVAVWMAGWRGVALAGAGLGTLVVWARGYLVPGTPRFAPRLVDALPIPGDPFHGADRPAAGGLGGDPQGGAVGEEVLSSLVSGGVLAPDGEMLYLTEAFENRWHAEMAELRALDLSELAGRVRAVAPPGTSVRELPGDDATLLLREAGGYEGTLLSRPVAVADVAAMGALEPDLPDAEARRRAARPLRMFLEDCPDCGATLEESTVRACCGGGANPRAPPPGRTALFCPDCDERLFTYPE